MFYIEPGFCCFCALAILILPLPWLLAAVFAALIHELCHLIAIFCFAGSVQRITIAAGGMEIQAALPDKRREFLAILAGPVGSFLLMGMTLHWMPETALCGLAHGVFNLLPVYPLDGGRALRCLLELNCPDRAERIASAAEGVVLLLLLIAAGYATVCLHMGIGPMAAAFVPVSGWIQRKIPCKQERIGVQ